MSSFLDNDDFVIAGKYTEVTQCNAWQSIRSSDLFGSNQSMKIDYDRFRNSYNFDITDVTRPPHRQLSPAACEAIEALLKLPQAMRIGRATIGHFNLYAHRGR